MPLLSLLDALTTVNTLLRTSLLLWTTLWFSCGHADNAFVFNKETTRVTRDIVETIQREHYRKLAINDAFANQLMTAYLDALDPAKVVFLAADIQEFHRSENQLDDQLRTGQLDLAALIYRRYADRSQALLKRTLGRIDDYLKPYPTPDQTVEIDRKDAHWPASLQESIELWDKRVYSEVIDLKLADMKEDEIRQLIKRRYQDRINRLDKARQDDIYEVFINSMTGLYDPHTNWLSPRAEENFRINMSLSLEGIGAVLQMNEEKTKITSLVTGGPAARLGSVLPGDHILAVGQGKDGEMETVIGWRLDEVVEKIRGPSGSYVRLQIESGQDKSIKQVVIQREKVKLEDQAAKKSIIEIQDGGGKKLKFGIINVPSFYLNFDELRQGDENFRSTTRDVAKLLDELKSEKVDGVILDLRNNGGGSLREAATFTDLFIDKGPVVQIRSADNQVSRGFRAQNPPYYTGPLLVLINHLSASASEIFAGAIQDYGRGLVIGEQSFGKGTVQTIADLDYGQLKLTNSKFYRVSGDSTQLRGVIPDITLPSPFDFKTIGESALDNALPWDNIHPVSYMKFDDIKPMIGEINKLHQARMKNDPDYQFLKERIAYMEKRRSINALPLDESKRRQERMDNEAALLAMSNKAKKARGLPLFDTYEDLEKEETEKMAKQSSPSFIDTENDFILQESARILSDFKALKFPLDKPGS